MRSPEGDELRDRLRANVERLRPGHPSPIVPVVCGERGRARSPRPKPSLERGLLVTAIRPPTVPPGTSRLRVALSAAHTAEQVDQLATALAELVPGAPVSRPRTLVFVSGTATEVGKTWWAAATARELRDRGRRGRRPQAGAVGRARRGRPTPRCSPHATGEDPATVCPPQRTYPLAVGAADGRRASWASPASPPPISPAGSRGPTTIDVGFVEGVGGPARRSATTATTSTSRTLLAPDLVVVVADAGLGTINAVRLSVAAYAGFATRRRAQPLRHRSAARTQPRAPRDRRRLRRGDCAARPR